MKIDPPVNLYAFAGDLFGRLNDVRESMDSDDVKSIKDGILRERIDAIDRLKPMRLTTEHPHCVDGSAKRDGNTHFNPGGPSRLKEKNRHGGAGCVIPRLWLWRYRRDRYRHSLNLKCDADTVYWYDFV